MRLRSSVRSAYETGQEQLLSAHNEVVESLKSEILTELKAEIKLNFAALINSSSLTPKITKRPTLDPMSIRSRRLFAPNKENKQPKTSLIAGTGSSTSTLGVSVVPTKKQKFWLYLSRISPSVTVEQVVALAKQRLETDEVEVVKLVARGRDVSMLTFISFKVGIDEELKTKALSSSTWPKGIFFRQFTDNRSNKNFWEPQRTPTNQYHRTTDPITREHSLSPMQVNAGG